MGGMSTQPTMDEIIALAKRRGFIFQGSEIYGGLSGTWDMGPLGVLLKERIKALWRNMVVESREDMFELDAALIMHHRVWDASGHTATFGDPLVTDVVTNKRYRADHLLEEKGIDVGGKSPEEMTALLEEHAVRSPDGNKLSAVQFFNIMFPVKMGTNDETALTAYLRGETAQGIFVNFKNVIDSFHPELPFGIAQIGKAFRNEINPRDFVFRSREFEQMEIEYFVHPDNWEAAFTEWLTLMRSWIHALGIPDAAVVEKEIPDGERAHYSKRTIDIEFAFPFGVKELYGIAYRTDFDLASHEEASGTALYVVDPSTGEKIRPHVIEPTFGLERTMLALFTTHLATDDVGGEGRTVLRLPPYLAPIRAVVSPLLKNKPELQDRARALYMRMKREIGSIAYDDHGNIGKRYRRQDEIGTPFCITVDFDTLQDGTVTLRYRDTGEQVRMSEDEVIAHVRKETLLYP